MMVLDKKGWRRGQPGGWQGGDQGGGGWKGVGQSYEGLALLCRYGDGRRGDHKVMVVVVVLDKEADVGVNQEVDKEVTKVVEEFCCVGIV